MDLVKVKMTKIVGTEKFSASNSQQAIHAGTQFCKSLVNLATICTLYKWIVVFEN